MFWNALDNPTLVVAIVLVLAAEFSNGFTDAPCATASSVSTGVFSRKVALHVAAMGNFIGLLVAYAMGASVAKTIGSDIVDNQFVSVVAINIALITVILWAIIAALIGLAISKTHSLLAALAGIGYAGGGMDALIGKGWAKVGLGVLLALLLGSTLSYLVCWIIKKMGWHKSKSKDTIGKDKFQRVWNVLQMFTVLAVAIAHGGSDGMKYVGIFGFIMVKSGLAHSVEETLSLATIIVFGGVMFLGTLGGGWRIVGRMEHMVNAHVDKDDPLEHHEELSVPSGAIIQDEAEHTHCIVGNSLCDHHLCKNKKKKTRPFKPYMSVGGEMVSAFLIMVSQVWGVPISTNHAVVAATNGAKAVSGKIHQPTIIMFVGGWSMTVIFCFGVAFVMAKWY